jgi:hypothetical protein
LFDGTSPPSPTSPYVNIFNFVAVQNISPESKKEISYKNL